MAGESNQTLLRFVLQRPHPDTGVEDGVFSAAYELRDGTRATVQDRELLTSLLLWFETNLAIPKRFNRTSSKGHYRRNTAGVSWIKSSAQEHIARIRALVHILENNGYTVSQIKTTKPGYVIFQDDHQVIAEPFRDSR